MNSPQKPPNWLVILVLIVGILTVSTAAILIRLANAAANLNGVGFSLVLAASRLTLASLILLPAWRQIDRRVLQPGAIRYAGAAGLCLAIHFAVWIASLSYTSIAASTALVTTNPVWVTLISWLWFREKPSRLSAIGIALALLGGLGVGLGSVSSTSIGSHPLLGNILALLGSWAVSFYLLLGREAQKRGLSIGGYIAIAYTTAAFILLPLPLAFGVSYTGYPILVYFYILLTALLPQLIGHTSFNWVVLWISPTLVTLAILFEPVCASFLGYLLFGEIPTPLVLAGATILVIGVAIAAIGTREKKRSTV